MERQRRRAELRQIRSTAKTEMTINAVNMLSIKPVLLFSAYAMAKLRTKSNSIPAKGLSRSVTKLKRLSSQMQSGDIEIYGVIGHTITNCVKSYVDLFYEAGKEELKGYMSGCVDEFVSNPNNSMDNMFIFPALMADLEKPREETYETILSEVRRKPTSFIARHARNAVELSKYMESRGIGSQQYRATEPAIIELMDKIIELLHEIDMDADYTKIATGNGDIIRHIESMSNKNMIGFLNSAVLPIDTNPSRIRRK